MGNLLTGVIGFVAGLALGALATYLLMVSRTPRKPTGAWKEQPRQWQRAPLLASLEALDLGMTSLAMAALQGGDGLAPERAASLAQVTNAANRSGDDVLRRLVETVVAHCDTLSAAGPGGENRERLVQQLGGAQREVYRRIEMLLGQTFD
jgi:hypothetical protein